jgi:hypothetical protein
MQGSWERRPIAWALQAEVLDSALTCGCCHHWLPLVARGVGALCWCRDSGRCPRHPSSSWRPACIQEGVEFELGVKQPHESEEPYGSDGVGDGERVAGETHPKLIGG